MIGFAACGGGEDDDVQKNVETWRSLPTFPDSTFLAQGNEPIHEGEGGDVIGYVTRVSYQVPDGITADSVIAFYIESLEEEWAHCEDDQESISVEGPGHTPASTLITVQGEVFVREKSTVTVWTFGMADAISGGTYELLIDSAAESDPCTSEVFE